MAVIDSFPSTNWIDYITSELTAGHRGQSFQVPAGNDYQATAVKLYMRRSSTGAGTVKGAIHAHSGTYGTDSVLASTTPIIESTAITVMSISTDLTMVSFPLNSTVDLLASTNYCAALQWVNAGGGVAFGLKNSTASPTHAGNYFSNGSPYSTRDMCFEVDGDAIVTATTVDVGNAANISDITVQVPTISSQVKPAVPVTDISVLAPNPFISSAVNLTAGNDASVSIVVQVPTIGLGFTRAVENVANVSVDTPVPAVSSQVKLTVSNAANVDMEAKDPSLAVNCNINVPVITILPVLFAPVVTKFVNRAQSMGVGHLRTHRLYSLRMDTDLFYDRASLCPSCGSTVLTRVLHSTSYNWTCENAHTWQDEGASRIKIKKIRW
jgi:hypothetical protein